MTPAKNKKDKKNRKNKTATSAGFRIEEGWRVHTAPDGRRYYHHQPTKTTQWAAPPGWQDAAATPAGAPFARGPHGLLPALYADGVEIRRQVERRFCGNVTEVVTGAPLIMSAREKLSTVFDLRTCRLEHVR